MKIAFISDIHGNYYALKAVLKHINKLKITNIYCLGDYLNYYYDPDKCIDLLIKNKVNCIKGNHEEIFFQTLKGFNIPVYKKKYGNSVELNLKKLKKHHINFLKSLKKSKRIKINKLDLLLSHGTPWDIDCYAYPNMDDSLKDRMSKYKADYIFLGHTHIPMNIKINKKTTVLNPGSVGQPRNRCNNACWLLFNTKDHKTDFMQTKYDKNIKFKKNIFLIKEFAERVLKKNNNLK